MADFAAFSLFSSQLGLCLRSDISAPALVSFTNPCLVLSSNYSLSEIMIFLKWVISNCSL